MPAIQLSRLKPQLAELTVSARRSAQQPAQFLRGLHDLLEYYADRTLRQGGAGARIPRLPHYNVSPQVLRALEGALVGILAEDPANGLALADLLWEDGHFETRLLAASLLRSAPADPPEAVLERVRAWADPKEEPRVLDALLSSQRFRLIHENPAAWLALLSDWLRDPRPAIQGIGLHGLQSIAADESYPNLPAVYRILSPVMQSIGPSMQSDMLRLVEILARRSPPETAYFLRQALALGRESGVVRLVRRSLPFFQDDLREGLRAALVDQMR